MAGRPYPAGPIAGANNYQEAPEGHDYLDLPPVMTVAEVKTLLRLSKNTVYEALKSGAIPGMLKVGRAVRVSGPVLARWLQEGSSPTRNGK